LSEFRSWPLSFSTTLAGLFTQASMETHGMRIERVELRYASRQRAEADD